MATLSGRPRCFAGRGLYAITPDYEDTDGLLARLGPVLAASPALLQYRNKLADDSLRREQAEAVLRLCRAAGVPLIINDDVELAMRIDADGVHIGGSDGETQSVRNKLGRSSLLGVSCYADIDRARAAREAGADYLAFGAVWPSSTKPDAVRAPLSLFAEAGSLGLPLVAIGGITLDNTPALIAAGADMVAVISDVFLSENPGSRAAAYQRLFSRD